MEMQEIVSQAVRLSFSSVDQSTTPAKIFCLTVIFYQSSLILFYLRVTNKRRNYFSSFILVVIFVIQMSHFLYTTTGKMRSILSIVMLICLVSAINFQPSHSSSHQKPGFQLKGLIQKGLDGLEELRDKHAVGKDVISSRKLGLGLKFKAILLKPLLLVVLAKIKLALLLGKPLALLALKKLLLKGVLGKLLLKIPLILLGGKAVLLAKVLALKFALITKGLIGLKAPLALLFLGGFLKGALKGSGLGLALGLAGSLLKQTGHGSSGEEYDEPAYYAPPAYGQILPPPPPPSYGAAVPYSEPLHLHAPPAYSSAPVYSAPAYQSQYTQESSAYYGSEHSGYGRYDGGRKKRNADDSEEEEEVEDSEEEFSEESPEELRLEIEAARTNVHAYLYMAAQFDEQSCGRRLMCEVYQKPQGSHTEDELILQDIFG